MLKALQHDLKAAKAQLSQSTSALQTLEVERARLVEQVSPLEGERSRVSGLGLARLVEQVLLLEDAEPVGGEV